MDNVVAVGSLARGRRRPPVVSREMTFSVTTTWYALFVSLFPYNFVFCDPLLSYFCSTIDIFETQRKARRVRRDYPTELFCLHDSLILVVLSIAGVIASRTTTSRAASKRCSSATRWISSTCTSRFWGERRRRISRVEYENLGRMKSSKSWTPKHTFKSPKEKSPCCK